MGFGELVAVVGSAELLLLLVALAATLVRGDPPPRLGPEPRGRPSDAARTEVKEAA